MVICVQWVVPLLLWDTLNKGFNGGVYYFTIAHFSIKLLAIVRKIKVVINIPKKPTIIEEDNLFSDKDFKVFEKVSKLNKQEIERFIAAFQPEIKKIKN